jgi:(R,R)-butanediol dehydrogenase/meso-butanediol dehydrogenase/diacetyl reductase
VEPFLWSLNDLTLVGTWCYGVNDWPRLIAQIASGRLPVERILTGRVPIERALADGFDQLLDPLAGHIKILVEPNPA